jgi:hypothetical protein
MKKFLISILIGVLAGVIDIIPMIMQNLDWRADVSAFLQWVILGVFINYIQFKMPAWLKGLIVAELAAIPILVIVSANDIFTIFPIIGMSAILGCLVGVVGSKYAVE